MPPDSAVEPDAQRDVAYSGIDFLAQIGNFVDEGDLRGEEAVRRIFDQLRRTTLGRYNPRRFDSHCAIQTAQRVQSALRIRADHHAVGHFEVLDCAPGPKKLRIGSHIEIKLGPQAFDEPLNLLASADRYGGFNDDKAPVLQRGRDLPDGLVKVGEIRGTVLPA